MGLETGTYISDFNATNPAHTDSVGAADGHLRWIKAAILASFTGITGAVTATHTQLNSAAAAVVTGTAAIIAALGSAAAPTYGFLGDSNTGMYSPGADQLSLVTGGVQAVKVKADQSVEFTGVVLADGAYTGGTGQLGIVGEPRLWLADVLPTGNFAWLNGAAVSRASNPVLFALWGTKYGVGNGTTTFNLPNFQEVVPIGKAGMGGASDPGLVTNSGIGTTGTIVGEGVHTLTQAELPAFKPAITITDPGHTHSASSGQFEVSSGSGFGGSGGGVNQYSPGGSTVTVATTGVTAALTANLGSGSAHNLVQPSIVCNWITLLG